MRGSFACRTAVLSLRERGAGALNGVAALRRARTRQNVDQRIRPDRNREHAELAAFRRLAVLSYLLLLADRLAHRFFHPISSFSLRIVQRSVCHL